MLKFNAFEEACLKGYLEQVKSLLSNDLNYCVNYELSPDGETPLILAIKSKEIKVVKLLLEQGADPNLTSNVGPLEWNKWHEGIQDSSPLYVAARESTTEIAELLILNGAEINYLTLQGGTPLYVATLVHNLAMVRLLLRHGADPNLCKPSATFSNIPLFWAVFECRLEIIKELHKYGADINAKNTDGETALFWAHTLEVVKELVSLGIDIHAISKKRETALTKAQQRKDWKSVEFLNERLGGWRLKISFDWLWKSGG